MLNDRKIFILIKLSMYSTNHQTLTTEHIKHTYDTPLHITEKADCYWQNTNKDKKYLFKIYYLN